MPHDLGQRLALNRLPMVTARSMMAEVVRVLAVLALVFLSFAHQPALAAPGYHADHGGSDLCGTPPADPDHAPCHACRASPAVLPPAPSVAEPAFVVAGTEVCHPAPAAGMADLRLPANPRAPPVPV